MLNEYRSSSVSISWLSSPLLLNLFQFILSSPCLGSKNCKPDLQYIFKKEEKIIIRDEDFFRPPLQM